MEDDSVLWDVGCETGNGKNAKEKKTTVRWARARAKEREVMG